MLIPLQTAGAPYGITFNFEVIINSRLALEAGEFAREKGKFEEAHTRLFQAYFSEGQNIGEKAVVLKLLKEIGVEESELNDALESHIYTPRLEQARQLAQKHDINVLPTFIFDGRQKIVGAQPYAVFQRALQKL